VHTVRSTVGAELTVQRLLTEKFRRLPLLRLGPGNYS
jgi:hypothetical protein